MKHFILCLLFLTICMLTSCEKVFFGKDEKSFSRVENFEYLWKQCDEKYSYFEHKGVDWNQIHAKYAALVDERLSEDLFFTLMGTMLNELKDGHVNLRSSFNVSRYVFSLQNNRSYDSQVILKNYISTNYYTTGSFVHDFIKNHPQVAYIRLSTFPGTITDYELNFILDRYKDVKGIVFDIRQNGGGVIDDVYTIISHFIDKKTTVWQSQIRDGYDHNDFSPLQPSDVMPSAGTNFTGKVILLTNKGTYSSGSFLALATRALPNMSTMGDDTGGGLGLPNGGQLPNGWTYRFSITRALDMAQNNFENGVPADVKVFFDANNNPQQKDAIVEQAITNIEQ